MFRSLLDPLLLWDAQATAEGAPTLLRVPLSCRKGHRGYGSDSLHTEDLNASLKDALFLWPPGPVERPREGRGHQGELSPGWVPPGRPRHRLNLGPLSGLFSWGGHSLSKSFWAREASVSWMGS